MFASDDSSLTLWCFHTATRLLLFLSWLCYWHSSHHATSTSPYSDSPHSSQHKSTSTTYSSALGPSPSSQDCDSAPFLSFSTVTSSTHWIDSCLSNSSIRTNYFLSVVTMYRIGLCTDSTCCFLTLWSLACPRCFHFRGRSLTDFLVSLSRSKVEYLFTVLRSKSHFCHLIDTLYGTVLYSYLVIFQTPLE